MRVLIESRSAADLRLVVKDALASLHQVLEFPERDSLSERARHLLGVEHFATLAMACAAAGDWRGSSSNLLHALDSERALLGEAAPLRAALTRARFVVAA